MPAMDKSEHRKTHIKNRNLHDSKYSLCGKLLDDVAYYEDENNFQKATCITCKYKYFGEM